MCQAWGTFCTSHMPEMLSNYTVLSLVSMVKMFFLKEDHRKNRLAAMFFVLHKDEDEKKKTSKNKQNNLSKYFTMETKAQTIRGSASL